MASLERLPPDQRAVLDLVLKRGRTYDEIAQMLGIDRAGVRNRALAALDALGPQTRIPPERRALITDYLLGQLPSRVAEETRERLGQSASERAWARVLASELAPIAGRPLPEIPIESLGDQTASTGISEGGAGAAKAATAREDGADNPKDAPAREAERRRGEPAAAVAAAAAEPPGPGGRGGPGGAGAAGPQPGRARPSSRIGGAIVLGVGAIVVIAVVVVLIVTGGSSSKSPSSHASTSSAASTTTTQSSATTPTSTTTARLVAQVNLKSPVAGSKAAGLVLVVKQGTKTGIAIRAQNIPPNGKHDAYAVWLYNSPTDSLILGYVNPPVTSRGVLQAERLLPSNAAHFKQILVTLETTSNPRTPGQLILEGTLTGLS
jgi:hypothetical protein